MPAYAICYDLMSPGQKYEAINTAIRAEYGTNYKFLDTTWFVVTDDTPSDIRAYLKSITDRAGKPIFDSNDELFIVTVSAPWAASHLSEKVTDWLHEHV